MMQTLRAIPFLKPPKAVTLRGAVRAALSALVEMDQHWRDSRAIARLDAHRRADAGLPSRDRNEEFYRRLGAHRWAPYM